MGKKHRKWRRRSRIETELPKKLYEEVNRLLLEGYTYEQVAAYCKENGHDISRSAVGRYGKVFFETYAKVKRFEDQAAALTSATAGELPMDEAISKLMLQKLLEALMDGDLNIMEYPKIVSSVAALQNSNIHREKYKMMAQKVREASAQVNRIVQKEGLSDTAADAIKKQILGIMK